MQLAGNHCCQKHMTEMKISIKKVEEELAWVANMFSIVPLATGKRKKVYVK
jgi:hypothetical protein